jgi:hypothetical protein
VIALAEQYGTLLVLDVIEALWGNGHRQFGYPTGRAEGDEEPWASPDLLEPQDLPRAAVEPLRHIARRQRVPLRGVVKAFDNWVATGALETAVATARPARYPL